MQSSLVMKKKRGGGQGTEIKGTRLFFNKYAFRALNQIFEESSGLYDGKTNHEIKKQN